MLRYRTTPALQWRIVADGVTAEEFDAVAADVAVLLEEVPPSDYTYLRDPLVDDPMGSFSIADGVITQVPTEFVITTVGSSVDNAANGSGVDDATYGGKEQWTANQAARAFEAAFSDFGGGLDIIPDQQAVNSQALQSFAAQLAASPYATRKVLIIAPGPNDAGPKSFTSNAVWTSFRGHIESLIEAGRDDGASVLLITPPGYHPDLAPTGLAGCSIPSTPTTRRPRRPLTLPRAASRRCSRTRLTAGKS
jgi:phenylpyruvate tautomerase PptA (4-oxalocrotonate tautomerase family)